MKLQTDILDALALDSIDALNLKPTRVGGLTKAARIRDLAQASGLKILLDEPQGADLATAALAQLAATIDPGTSSGPDASSARTCPSPTRKPDHQGRDRNSTTAPFTGAMLPAWASMLTRTCSGRRFSS